MRSPLLWLALACHLFLATGYALLTPSFEGPDENSHYEYAWHIANGGQLPLSTTLVAARALPQTEGAVLAHHPPLYYSLLAGCLVATGSSDTIFGPVMNPDFARPGTANQHLKTLHGGDEEAPWARARWVLVGLRFLSVLLGLVSILCVHRLGRACCPERALVADVAALLVSCLPMWSFLHGVLNNDSLATTLATACLLMLVKIARSEHLTVRTSLVAGVLLGLALLTKLTTLFLLPLAMAVFVVFGVRRPAQRSRSVVLGIGLVTIAAAISGWWFIRNLRLYGDPLALSVHDAAFQPIPAEARWHYFWGTSQWPEALPSFLPDVFTSLLGRFGWFHLPPPPILVWAGAALAAVACLGLLRALFDRAQPCLPRPLWLLAGACGLVFAGTANFNLTAPQPQGRLLFPAIGPAAVLLAAGLLGFGKMARLQRVGNWLCVLPPLAGVLVLFVWFKPAFDPSLAPGPDHHASMVGGILDAVETPGITWREPFPELPAKSPPMLRWSEPGAPADALYSLYAYDARGRVLLATYEWGHFELRGGEAPFPAPAWNFLPQDRDVFLTLRRVPNWRKGERLADMPASAPLPFRRE